MVSPTNSRAVSKITGVAIALLVAACASGQSSTVKVTEISQGPAIWRVADDDTTIFIYGTADSLAPETEWRSDAVVTSLATSDRIILETDDSPEMQATLPPVIQSLGLYSDGGTLRGTLTDAQAEEIDAVTSSFGAPLVALDQLKPWLAAIQIGALNAQKQGYQTWRSGLSVLNDEAVKTGKPVTYLEESRADILRAISQLPEDVHVNMLVLAARQVRDEPQQAGEVVPIWLAGDVDALAERYHGEGRWADQRLYDTLLVKRNRDWTGQVINMLATEEGVIFFAVGTGHVLGADSLQNMLKARGVALTRL